jgi:hypothetical protein
LCSVAPNAVSSGAATPTRAPAAREGLLLSTQEEKTPSEPVVLSVRPSVGSFTAEATVGPTERADVIPADAADVERKMTAVSEISSDQKQVVEKAAENSVVPGGDGDGPSVRSRVTGKQLAASSSSNGESSGDLFVKPGNLQYLNTI